MVTHAYRSEYGVGVVDMQFVSDPVHVCRPLPSHVVFVDVSPSAHMFVVDAHCYCLHLRCISGSPVLSC